MNVLPSMSVSRAPDARLMKSGAAPTDLKARTGLSTPPGRICCARAKRVEDLVDCIFTTEDTADTAGLSIVDLVIPDLSGNHHINRQSTMTRSTAVCILCV